MYVNFATLTVDNEIKKIFLFLVVRNTKVKLMKIKKKCKKTHAPSNFRKLCDCVTLGPASPTLGHD